MKSFIRIALACFCSWVLWCIWIAPTIVVMAPPKAKAGIMRIIATATPSSTATNTPTPTPTAT